MYWTSDTPQPKTEAGTEGVQGLGVSGAMKMLLHNLNGNLRYFPSRASKLHRKGSVRVGREGGGGTDQQPFCLPCLDTSKVLWKKVATI